MTHEEIEKLLAQINTAAVRTKDGYVRIGNITAEKLAEALRHQRQYIADLTLEADRHVEEINKLRKEANADDAKIAELERRVTLLKEIADAREFDWRQAKRSVREAIAEWETIKQQTIYQCNGHGFDGKTCLRCRADTVFKRIALEAE